MKRRKGACEVKLDTVGNDFAQDRHLRTAESRSKPADRVIAIKPEDCDSPWNNDSKEVICMKTEIVKCLAVTNKVGIAIVIFYIFYLLVLFPSTLNPYGEISVAPQKYHTSVAPQKYHTEESLEKFSQDIDDWVEASNIRAKYLLFTMLTFLCVMLVIFLFTVRCIRK